MSEEYPLFPTLPEEGQREAQSLIDRFKDELKKVCDNTLSELYTDVACYIESDSWSNYRNQLLDGFRNYNNRKIQGEHDFAKIRAEIYKQFRSELITDLNQDLLAEIDELKETINILQNANRLY